MLRTPLIGLVALTLGFSAVARAGDCDDADAVSTLATVVQDAAESAAFASIAGFNASADALLTAQDTSVQDKLSRMGIEEPPSMTSLYKIELDTECLDEAAFGELSIDRKRELLAQARGAAAFLSDVHVSMRGSNVPPVQFINICPQWGSTIPNAFGVNGPTYQRRGETIDLTLWRSWYGFDPADSHVMREAWDDGDMMNFPNKKLEIAWRLFGNPLGTIRSRARARLSGLDQQLQDKLGGMSDGSSPVERREEILDLVAVHVNPEYVPEGTEIPLAEEAVTVVQALNDEGLKKFVETYEAFVADDGNQEKSRAAVARVVTDQETNVDRTNIAVVVFTNHKDINVMSHFQVGSEFDQFVTRRTRDVRVHDINAGVIVIDLSDNINVETELLWGKVAKAAQESKVLGTAGLEAAIKRVRQSPDLYFTN